MCRDWEDNKGMQEYETGKVDLRDLNIKFQIHCWGWVFTHRYHLIIYKWEILFKI